MPNVTVAIVAQMLPGAPRANIEANLRSVLFALCAAQQQALPIVIASLATIAAETASFAPISEGVSKDNTSPGGRPFDLYDNDRALGNLGASDGANFRGRGYVQLTGRNNYVNYGALVGEPDLPSQPELANQPDIAASLLAAFIKTHAVEIGVST